MDNFHEFVSQPEIMWTTQEKFIYVYKYSVLLRPTMFTTHTSTRPYYANTIYTKFYLNSLECMEDAGINLFTHLRKTWLLLSPLCKTHAYWTTFCKKRLYLILRKADKRFNR